MSGPAKEKPVGDGTESKAVVVAYFGLAITPAQMKRLACLQALRSRLGIGLLPQSRWGQGA